MYLPLIAIFIAISGSMGISYMAEDSLPGEPLYAIKVHINDNLKELSGRETGGFLPTSSGTSSDLVYLRASANASSSIEGEDSAGSSANVNVSDSTDLNVDQVINTE